MRGNLSVLAARRSTSKANNLRIETDRNKLDLKSLMQNANFELGSSQFDIPSFKYTPRINKNQARPKTVVQKKSMLAGSTVKIDKMDPQEFKNGFYGYSSTQAKSDVWKKMSNFITAK